MARKPVAEAPPSALIEEREAGNPEWVELWNSTLRVLKDQGTWKPELRVHLEAYLNYRRLSKLHREEAERDPFTTHMESGRVFAHPGFALARDAEREARALAELLILTPKSRRDHGIDNGEGHGDPDGDQAGL